MQRREFLRKAGKTGAAVTLGALGVEVLGRQEAEANPGLWAQFAIATIAGFVSAVLAEFFNATVTQRWIDNRQQRARCVCICRKRNEVWECVCEVTGRTVRRTRRRIR